MRDDRGFRLALTAIAAVFAICIVLIVISLAAKGDWIGPFLLIPLGFALVRMLIYTANNP